MTSALSPFNTASPELKQVLSPASPGGEKIPEKGSDWPSTSKYTELWTNHGGQRNEPVTLHPCGQENRRGKEGRGMVRARLPRGMEPPTCAVPAHSDGAPTVCQAQALQRGLMCCLFSLHTHSSPEACGGGGEPAGGGSLLLAALSPPVPCGCDSVQWRLLPRPWTRGPVSWSWTAETTWCWLRTLS